MFINLSIKRIVFTFGALALSFFGVFQVASAHVLKSDGQIGAVLHINPDDDPIANEPAAFYFAIKDTSNKFDPIKCDCHFIVLKGEQTIFDKPISIITQSGELTGIIGYTFTDRAIYTVILKGTPKTANTFQPFSLNYDIRVSRTGTSATNSTVPAGPFAQVHIVHFVLFGGAFIAIFYVIWDEKRKERKALKNKSQLIKSIIIILAISSFVIHSSGTHCFIDPHMAQLPCCTTAPASLAIERVTVNSISVVWRTPPISYLYRSIELSKKVSNKSPPIQRIFS